MVVCPPCVVLVIKCCYVRGCIPPSRHNSECKISGDRMDGILLSLKLIKKKLN